MQKVQTPSDSKSTAITRDPFRQVRASEFPWTAETLYLNNASIGPIPERTRRLLDDFNAKRTAPYLLPDRDLMAMLSGARAAAAELINASVDEIGLAINTSHGLNLAATALPLRSGDTVLVSDREFPANVYPWLLLREKGVNVELAPTTPEGWPDEAYLLERLADPRVRVLAMSFVQFSNGYKADLKLLGEACRENGQFFVVDAIQGLGQLPIDVQDTPIDILACGGQKWLLSPWGSGFVYVRHELMKVLEPVVTGWMAFEGTDDFSHLTDYNPQFRDTAQRFETVTLPFQDLAGMKESISVLLHLGLSEIADHLRTLVQPIWDRAGEDTYRVTSPMDDHASGIVCVAPRKIAEAYHELTRANVVCAMREGSIRLSPHCFNTVDEMERVADILCGGAG
jgi:cysteine desulfurase/selenocysteine lyase